MSQIICCEFVEMLLKKLDELLSENKLFQETEKYYGNYQPLTPLAFAIIQAIVSHMAWVPLGCAPTLDVICAFKHNVRFTLELFQEPE